MDSKHLIIVSNFLAILANGFVILEKDSLSEKKSSLKTAELDLLRSKDLLDEIDLIQPVDVDSIVVDDSDNFFKSDVPKDDVIDSEYETVNGILCRKCQPGTGLIATCNATHQTVCESCQSGISYSANVPHFRPCSPCSRCGPGMFVDKKCSPELDTFCDWCHGVKSSDYLRTLLSENENFLEKCDVIASLNKLNAEELTQDQVHDSSEELKLVTRIVAEQSAATVGPFVAIDKLIIEDSEASEEKLAKQDRAAANVFDQMALMVTANTDKKLVSDNVADDQDIVYKPSIHTYPYDELMHHQNGILSKIVENRHLILAVACISCFLATLLVFRRRSCRQSKKVKEVLIKSTLTDEDDRIIHECAQKMMYEEQKSNEKSQNRRFNPFNRHEESASEDETETEEVSAHISDVNVTENPLIGYLEHEIQRLKIDEQSTPKCVNV